MNKSGKKCNFKGKTLSSKWMVITCIWKTSPSHPSLSSAPQTLLQAFWLYCTVLSSLHTYISYCPSVAWPWCILRYPLLKRTKQSKNNCRFLLHCISLHLNTVWVVCSLHSNFFIFYYFIFSLHHLIPVTTTLVKVFLIKATCQIQWTWTWS